jgi:hypothetical protein
VSIVRKPMTQMRSSFSVLHVLWTKCMFLLPYFAGANAAWGR